MNGKHETFQQNIVKLDEAEAQVRKFFQDSLKEENKQQKYPTILGCTKFLEHIHKN